MNSEYGQPDNKLRRVSNPFLSIEIGELGNIMMSEKGGTELSVGRESNVVGHLMPEMKSVSTKYLRRRVE